MHRQDMLEKAGRLTSGDTKPHERRIGLSRVIMECHFTIKNMLRNWPGEYELPDDHNLHELLEVMGIVADELETDPDAEKETDEEANDSEAD